MKGLFRVPIHTIAPVFDKNSKILILGTFPSVMSRKSEFFYGHPQNRFWCVLAALYTEDVPVTTEEKKALLLSSNIALWDVIQSCDIAGSNDSSITNVVPNDISVVLKNCDIRAIYANGATAGRLYNKYIRTQTSREISILPSTSPANASYSLDRLCGAWGRIVLLG